MTNEELEGTINSLFKSLSNFFPSVESRLVTVGELAEQYFDANLEYPPSNFLDRMATYILVRDSKAKKGEAMLEELPEPYLSESQYNSRIKKEVGASALEVTDGHRDVFIPPTRDSRRSWKVSK